MNISAACFLKNWFEHIDKAQIKQEYKGKLKGKWKKNYD